VSAQALSDALWALLGAALLGLTAAAHLPRARLLRLSVLVRRTEGPSFLFVLIVLGWMWLGWHFFAR